MEKSFQLYPLLYLFEKILRLDAKQQKIKLQKNIEQLKEEPEYYSRGHNQVDVTLFQHSPRKALGEFRPRRRGREGCKEGEDKVYS